MSDDNKSEIKPNVSSDHINLKVTGQDGSVVHFKIKKHTQFKKLMDAYCDKQDISRLGVRFMFDGNPIADTQTPIELEMEEDDTIEVFQAQTGGSLYQLV